MAKNKMCFDIEKGFLEIWPVDKTNSEVFVRIVIENSTSSIAGKELKRFASNLTKVLTHATKK